MNQGAVELIRELRSKGVLLEVAGGRLRYHPASHVTPDQLARLKTIKAEDLAAISNPPAEQEGLGESHAPILRKPRTARAFVLHELRRLRAAGQREDAIEARYRWRERAAICEYDGNLPRVQAESLAAADLGALDHPGAGLIPDGWTRERWAARLEQMAAICVVPERAAELREWRAKILSEQAAKRV